MMSSAAANMPVLVVIAPLFTAFVLTTLARRIRLVEGLVVFTGILVLIGSGFLAADVFNKETALIYQIGGWPAPWGIELKAGSVGVFFLLVASFVSVPVSLFSVNNLSDEVGGKERTARFYVLYLLLCGAMYGMAVTNDLFNVFVLVEVATLSCCGLVSSRNRPRAAEAAFTYLILATLGSTLILGGIGFIYIITGHLNMGFVHDELNRIWQSEPHVVWTSFSFMLVGFGVKSALFPLHVWLPDAHSTAPSPASAILSGIAVKGYLICLLKILYNVFGYTLMRAFAINTILVLAGSIAIIAGAVLALMQTELKRRLAFSTVSQIGYIIMGIGIMNTKGLSGTLFYLAGHAVAKAVLFLAAGAMISASGRKKISELAGIGRKMPVTMAAFTVGSLGLTGIPLFSGFVGKWYLILGSLESGSFFPAVVIIAGSILCAAYLFSVVRVAYFEPAPDENWKDPGLAQKIALIVLASAVLVLGILPDPFLELAGRAAEELLALK